MVNESESSIYPVLWQGDHLVLIDQRQLPERYAVVSIHRWEDVLQALKTGIVHGGSALGIAAAYGLHLGSRSLKPESPSAFWERLEAIAEQLTAALPHKAYLQWAVNHVLKRAKALAQDGIEPIPGLLQLAQALQAEDLSINQAIGRHGLQQLPEQPSQLTLYTHCNHGALATGGYGTSLGIVRAAWAAGRLSQVYVGETRPGFQGSRLTAWECLRAGIPVTVVADSMAAHCMQQGRIDAVVVGADRVAANGDTLSKVGTYGLALAAQAHSISLLVAAPLATVDFTLATGGDFPLREQLPNALRSVGGQVLCPEGTTYYNPASDMTPAALITAIVTERGAVSPTQLETLARSA